MLAAAMLRVEMGKGSRRTGSPKRRKGRQAEGQNLRGAFLRMRARDWGFLSEESASPWRWLCLCLLAPDRGLGLPFVER